jgi:ubiquinone/menaquinone biosynthesis C-methylase UbiE
MLQCWCGLWGILLQGNSRIYGYIADTVRLHPDRPAIHQMFREQGFDIVNSHVALMGFVEILTVRKNVQIEKIP